MAAATVGVMGDCSQVAPRIFLGNAKAAGDTVLLEKLGITFVLNVADDLDKDTAALYEDCQQDGSIERHSHSLLSTGRRAPVCLLSAPAPALRRQRP